MYTISMSQHSKADEDSLTRLISLTEAAKMSRLTDGHLRKLARGGKIWARKFGRDWVTTEDAIKAYLATDRRTGKKPKKPS